jgi:hypothetical protein
LRVVLVAGSAALLLSVGAFNLRGYANAWWSSNARFHARRVLPQLAWVARSTRAGDVIAADAEAAIYLYTGRQAVPITAFTAAEYVRERTIAEDVRVAARLLEQYRPRYVLVTSPHLVEAAARLARERPTRLVRIDSLSQGVVYARNICMTLAGGVPTHGCE